MRTTADKKLKCPNCDHVEMTKVAVDLIDVDQCARCEGVWFDNFSPELVDILHTGHDRLPEELKKSLTADVGLLESTEGRNRLCPRCDKPMLSYWYAGQVGKSFKVDGCMNGCGVWFDDGELGKAFEFLKGRIKPETLRQRPEGIIARVELLRVCQAAK